MADITIYGIKNCNTMKKAFTWFDDNGIAYDFHDYKKKGADMTVIEQAVTEHGWEKVINRKGMTWRQLPDDVKNDMDEAAALELVNQKTSVIKRPLITYRGKIILGFDETQYTDTFL